MDILIGIVFWGGLLWLALAWLARAGRSEPTRPESGTGRGVADAGGTAASSPPGEQRSRVDDALSDGLVIGHFLTRDHYERRLRELEDSIEELGHERDPWLDCGSGDDDLEHGTDVAEFDAMGGFGVEPWADDLFALDDDVDDDVGDED